MVSHSGQVRIPNQIQRANIEGPKAEACKRTHQYKTLFRNSLHVSATVIESVTVIHLPQSA